MRFVGEVCLNGYGDLAIRAGIVDACAVERGPGLVDVVTNVHCFVLASVPLGDILKVAAAACTGNAGGGMRLEPAGADTLAPDDIMTGGRGDMGVGTRPGAAGTDTLAAGDIMTGGTGDGGVRSAGGVMRPPTRGSDKLARAGDKLTDGSGDVDARSSEDNVVDTRGALGLTVFGVSNMGLTPRCGVVAGTRNVDDMDDGNNGER